MSAIHTDLTIRALSPADVTPVATLWGLNVLDNLEILSYDRWGPGIAVPAHPEVDEVKVNTLDPKDGLQHLLEFLITSDKAFCLVAGEVGDPLGYVVGRVVDQDVNDFRHGQIDELYVREDSRRRGIGSALVAAAMRELRRRDATLFRVEVNRGWAGGRRFWDAQRWEQDAVVYRLYD